MIHKIGQTIYESVMTYFQSDPKEQNSVKFESKYKDFINIWKYLLVIGGHIVPAEVYQRGSHWIIDITLFA